MPLPRDLGPKKLILGQLGLKYQISQSRNLSQFSKTRSHLYQNHKVNQANSSNVEIPMPSE